MSDKFAQQIMKIAIAQICVKFGDFGHSEGRAFALLTDVIGKFIQKIGRLCRRMLMFI